MEQEARQRAVKELVELFDEPSKLKTLNAEASNYEKKLSSVKTQLVAGVQAQLDEMQVSVELMNAAETEMAAVRDTFNEIQRKCQICTRAIEDFDGILKLKNARENIRHVIEQLDMYDAVPQQVQRLELALENEEGTGSIKQVFLEWSTLRIWKDSIMAQVQADVTEAQRREEDAKKEDRTVSYKSSVLAQNVTYQILAEHFERVDALGERVWVLLSARFEHFMDLATYEPADLVTAVEIVERYERQQARERRKAVAAGRSLEDAVAAYPLGEKPRECIGAIERRMTSDVDQILPLGAGELNEEGGEEQEQRSGVKQVVELANKFVADLRFIHTDVAKCFPDHYGIHASFRRIVEKRLLAVFDPFWSDPELASGDTLLLVAWLDVYVDEVTRGEQQRASSSLSNPNAELQRDNAEVQSGSNALNALRKLEQKQLEAFAVEQSVDETFVKRFKSMGKKLMQSYIDVASQRIQQYARSILERDNVVERGREGVLETARPQDLFNAISQEMSIVLQLQVHGDRLGEFINGACLQNLQRFQQDSLAQVQEGMPSFEHLCAFVNDHARMYDLCDEALDNLLTGVRKPQTLVDSIDKTASAFAKCAKEGGTLLVAKIFDDLSPTLEEMFTEEWVDGKPIMLTMTHTLADFFEGEDGVLQCIRGDYHAGRCIATCFEHMVEEYLMRFLRRPKPVFMRSQCVEIIRADRANMEKLFKQYLPLLKYGKIYNESVFLSRLRVVQLLADFFHSSTPQMLFEAFASEFGAGVVTVVTRLVYLNGALTKTKQMELRRLIVSSEYATALPLEQAGRFNLAEINDLNAAADWSQTGINDNAEAAQTKSIFSRMRGARKSTVAANETPQPRLQSPPSTSPQVQTLNMKDFLK